MTFSVPSTRHESCGPQTNRARNLKAKAIQPRSLVRGHLPGNRDPKRPHTRAAHTASSDPIALVWQFVRCEHDVVESRTNNPAPDLPRSAIRGNSEEPYRAFVEAALRLKQVVYYRVVLVERDQRPLRVRP
jgi:hypothetical protein